MKILKIILKILFKCPFLMVCDFWKWGGMGKVMSVILAGCFISLYGLVLGGVYIAADSWGMPESEGTGVVESRSHSPAHTTFISTGKTMIPVYHPESWSVLFSVKGKFGGITGNDGYSVSEGFYNEAKRGSECRVLYQVGRLSGDIYITGIY